MSLKPVDMQMVVHRVNNAGLQQNQLSHKPMDDQNLLGQQMQKAVAEKNQKSEKLDESPHLIDKEGEGRHNKDEREKKRTKGNEKEEAKEDIKHPYKGHHIDLSL